ncbi:fungal-specific transcription factor domain-containing protein [Trichoderma austrokoningii]
MTISVGRSLTAKPTLPISPASSTAMSSARDGIGASPDGSATVKAETTSRDEGQRKPGDDQNEGSSNSEGPTRKRRRSRKGLEKRFECSAEGCGKSYSRAEHLYRHQLNHNSKQIFHCEYPDCPRTFVRGDLLKRHMDRHTAKGSQLNRRDSMASHATSATSPKLVPADSNRQGPGPLMPAPASVPVPAYNDPRPPPLTHHYHPSPQEPPGDPYPLINNGGPPLFAGHDAFARDAIVHSTTAPPPPPRRVSSGPAPSHGPPSRPSIQTNVGPYGVISPASSQQGYHSQSSSTPQTAAGFIPQHSVLPLSLPPAQYSHLQTAPAPRDGAASHIAATTASSAQYSDAAHHHPHSNEMMILDHMEMSSSGPVFADDGVNKSPYVGMPEDFMAYLFNSMPQNGGGSPHPQALPPPLLSYGDSQNGNYGNHYLDQSTVGFFPSDPQDVMAVNNLLEQHAPEASITEERSQEIYDLISERFKEDDEDLSARQRRVSILSGDRSSGEHMLGRRMMQAYVGSYWYHFSDQMPILHKPTFATEKTPNLLLIAIMAIGAACLDRTHGTKVTMAGAEVSNFLAEHLRWEVFMDRSFRPPAKLWVFQTLILLELYEKMYSTRELHERAHIHHATTVTLMRRGRSLIGKSTLDSPPQHSSDGSRKSSTSGIAQTADEWWNHWIINEATRRAAFAAFIIDSTHATMFGHSAVMVAHEMRLTLPCDESLWRAASSAEVGRVEANLMSRGIKPVTFLEGLKRTLSHQDVRTTPFGRSVLMAGLLSVTYHMHQRDLQVNVLGGGVIQALGGRDKWRATLTRAYDSWKSNFDRALEMNESDPYRLDSQQQDFNVVFESRTVLHHLAHMAMHADIVDCQMFARAKRLLGRSIGHPEFLSAQRRIKEYWAPSARARDATYYALKFLLSVLVPDQAGPPYSTSPDHDKPYETRDDVLLNRPWVLYFAALVVWCYGYAVEGPFLTGSTPVGHEEQWQQMRAYLTKYGGVTDPNELRNMRGINGNTALLMVLKDTFDNSRWELLHEGANLLHNCIVLNSGGIVL